MKKNINKYWNNYKEIYSFEEVLKIYRERKALECINSRKPKKILEIGCGFNPLFEKYTEFEEFTVIEPGEKAYNYIKEKSSNNQKIKCINNYFEDSLDLLKGEEFEYISSTGVLHETPTPKAFLETLRALSNIKTEIYLNVPNAFSMHRVIAKEMGLINNIHQKTERNILLEQNNIFDKKSLIKLLKETFRYIKIIECKTFFLKPFTHSQMMDCIDKKIINENIFEGLYSASDYYSDSGCELYCTFTNIIK